MTRYGLVLRAAPVPKKPATAAQRRVRAVMAATSAWWRRLTDDQRTAWEARASKAKSRTRMGRSAPLKGSYLFNKINCVLAAVGLPRVTDPPPLPKFGLNPVRDLSLTNTRGRIALLLSVPTPPAQYTLVLGSPPCSAGISCRCGFTILGLLPDPVRGVSDITDLYVKAYGKPPVGSRVFIRTRQVIDGWEDDPIQTTAIVPGV
jgi:hypothetical protein